MHGKPLKVGDRVYKQNFTRGKGKTDLKWLPGYRIIDFETGRTAVVEHTESKCKARVNVRHLRYADPISELIGTSSIDTFPGSSKLYFSADDLADLNWEAFTDLPQLTRELSDKAHEITRERSHELTPQEPPAKRQRVSSEHNSISEPTSEPEQHTRPKRARRRNVLLKDYIVNAVSLCPGTVIRTSHSYCF